MSVKRNRRIISLFVFGIIMSLICLCGCASRTDARDSVVLVETGDRSGTGFFVGRAGVSPDIVVTGSDIADTDGGGEIRVYLGDGTFVSADVVASDRENEITVLKLEKPAAGYVPLKLAMPDAGMTGVFVRIAGFDTSTGMPDAKSPKITEEKIVRIYTEAGSDTQRIMLGGNSAGDMPGAPVLNENGSVIGICCGHYPSGEDSAGNIPEQESVKYFESIEVVKMLLDSKLIANEAETAFPWIPVIIIAVAAIIAIFVILIVVRVIAKKKNPPKIQVNGAGPIPTASSDQSGDSGYRIECVEGALAGKKIMIKTSGAIVIGSKAGMCSVAIPGNPAGVGSRHCEIWFNGSEVCIRDAGSPHGTVLSSSARLSANETAVLNEGDGFSIGTDVQKFVIRKKKEK